MRAQADTVCALADGKCCVLVALWVPSITHEGVIMKSTIKASLLLVATLAVPVVALAADMDADRDHPAAYVKDSVITSKVKSKLAAEHIATLGRIHVDTDENGVVWLRGTARSQEGADRAVAIARDTDGVADVHSDIIVRSDK
jgi:hyperosmotically inducible protein